MIDSQEEKKHYSKIQRYIVTLIVMWTVVVAASLGWNLYQVKQHALIEARSQARAIYEKDVIYRRWNAEHGGVYVPVTEETPPNPYLSHIPERDVTTTSGKSLTLMNPAYMTRQVHELMEEHKGGIRGHLTSLNLLNPINKPDPWEIKALEAFEKGETEVSSVKKMEDGKTYMRLIRPMVTEERCLKCHAVQGYKVGDVRGGVSVSVPMEHLIVIVHKERVALMLGHGFLWLLGFGVIIIGGQRQKRAEEMIQLQLKRLNALRFIDMTITASLDLRDILDILLTQVTKELGIDAASVLLLNQHTQILEYVSSKGFRTSALKYTKLKLGESNAGRAALERRIVTLSNLKENIDGFVSSELFPNEDFDTYFAVPLVIKDQARGVLELFHRTPLSADPEWLEFLEIIADQAAMAIDNASLFDGLQRSNIELTLAYETTIEGWSRAMDLRDKETEGHTKRVAEMTLRIAREFGIKEEELVHMKRGALLHDIGKMGVPDNILLKPERLTKKEWEMMKRHSEYAYDMLYRIEYLRPALDIPHYHHEKWDGTGYPNGLKGEEIPLAARIFAVVDVWDALCSDRPYRPAWAKKKVREHIHSLAGTHFDPKVVEVFLKMGW